MARTAIQSMTLTTGQDQDGTTWRTEADAHVATPFTTGYGDDLETTDIAELLALAYGLSVLLDETNSGRRVETADAPSVSLVLQRIRVRADISWEHVAALVGVSRRTVHYWLSGSPMADHNRDRLELIDLRVGQMARSAGPAEVHDQLMMPRENGPSLFRRWVNETIRTSKPAYQLSDLLYTEVDDVERPEPLPPLRTGDRQIPEPTRTL